MNLPFVIGCVGFSHLLQPPVTLLLAKRLRLARAFSSLGPLAAQIARNMAFASVFLPTCAGVVVGLSAKEVVAGGAARDLAWVLAAFWSWRLARQMALRTLMPARWHWGLCAIFFVQGPALAALLPWHA